MSATTGRAPVDHGAVGYMQRFQNNARADCVFETDTPGAFPEMTTVFSDALTHGYRPICLDSDFYNLAGQWRDAVLTDATMSEVGPFYALNADAAAAAEVLDRLDRTLTELLRADQPTLIWCYVDVDLYIHRHGYDADVATLLDGVETVAKRASSAGDVVAVSDHGLVQTRHVPAVADALNYIATTFEAEMAGAGRTRWFHVSPAHHAGLKHALASELADELEILDRAELIPEGPYRARVGEVVIMPKGEAFVTHPDYAYDHGSLLETEVLVPWAHWVDRGA